MVKLPSMQSYLSSPWNNAVAFLSTSYGAQRIGIGSCFYWAFEGRTFLLTNWHVLSGRSPFTDEVLHSQAAIPDRATFWVYKRTSAEQEPDLPPGFSRLNYVAVEAKLCNTDWTNPRWFEHPTFGRRVDIAAIDVTEEIQGFQIHHANTLEDDAVLDLTTTQDVFVVGFPFGQIPNAPAPIWKRGSIALDPTFDPENLPKMFIDTATREGMSGSLVIARHIVVGSGYPKKDGTKSPVFMHAKVDLVAGIYSGRYYPDFEKAQLGIAWKRDTIAQTVAGRHVASV